MASLADVVPIGNVYPTYEPASFGSLGTSVTNPGAANSVSGGGESTTAAVHPVDKALAVGASGNPIAWWAALVVLLLVLMYGAQKLGADGEFSNLKMSAYNIFVITVAAIIGINLFKLLFTKFAVPGLSAVVLAA